MVECCGIPAVIDLISIPTCTIVPEDAIVQRQRPVISIHNRSATVKDLISIKCGVADREG